MADLADELRRKGFLDYAVALNLGTLRTNRFQNALQNFDNVYSFREPYQTNNSLVPLDEALAWAYPPSMNWLYAERGLFALEQSFFGRHVTLSHEDALSLISGALYQAKTALVQTSPDFVLDNSFLGAQRLALRAACAELQTPLLTIRHARLAGRYRISDADDRALHARYVSARESSQPERTAHAVRHDALRSELARLGSVAPELKQSFGESRRILAKLPTKLLGLLRATARWRAFDRTDYLACRATRSRKVINLGVRSGRAFRNRRILVKASRSFDVRLKRLVFTWHYQPEQSTSQGSPYFVHQARFVENVSRALPLDWELIVVPYWSRLTHMKVSDAKTLRMLPNVTISRPELLTGDVLAECDAIIALTGTSGFEGLVLGKPVFVFGDPDWRMCRSATAVHTFDELTAFLRNADVHSPDAADVAAFVDALRLVSVKLHDGRALSRRPDEVRGSATYKADIQKVAQLLVTSLEASE